MGSCVVSDAVLYRMPCCVGLANIIKSPYGCSLVVGTCVVSEAVLYRMLCRIRLPNIINVLMDALL